MRILTGLAVCMILALTWQDHSQTGKNFPVNPRSCCSLVKTCAHGAQKLQPKTLTGTSVLASEADDSMEMKLLSERGSTRATRYSNANKIVTLGGKTHIAWLDSVSRTMIATFDHESRQWSRAIHVGDGQDNHGGPALSCDSRGYLHIVFGPHASVPFQHCRSARPDKTQPHTGASLEQFTGHNPVAAPWLLFSTGPKGSDTLGKGVYHRVHAVLRRE